MIWMLKKLYYRLYQKMFKICMSFLDWSEPELMEGAGSVLQTPDIIRNNNTNKVLVVTDKGIMNVHLLDEMLNELKNSEIEYVIYDGVNPNPTIMNIEECREVYEKNNCQGFIAFGGGSPIDCAKVAAARIARPGKPIVKMFGVFKVRKKLPLFIAIPTTAGTGSETTVAAVVTNQDTHEKKAINDTCLRPKYAILDPNLTIKLPKNITSTTGMDALTHAIEAYIGKSNTAETQKEAELAVKLIYDNLEKCYLDGASIEARANMLKGSYYAGRAFSHAFVGYVHAIAHSLGGLYNVPHGLANAVILPYVLDWYGDTIYPQLAKLAKVINLSTESKSNSEIGKMFIEEIRRMNRSMDIPEKFDFIKEEDIEIIVKQALKEANPFYPVPKIMDQRDCESVIRLFSNKKIEVD